MQYERFKELAQKALEQIGPGKAGPTAHNLTDWLDDLDATIRDQGDLTHEEVEEDLQVDDDDLDDSIDDDFDSDEDDRD